VTGVQTCALPIVDHRTRIELADDASNTRDERDRIPVYADGEIRIGIAGRELSNVEERLRIGFLIQPVLMHVVDDPDNLPRKGPGKNSSADRIRAEEAAAG